MCSLLTIKYLSLTGYCQGCTSRNWVLILSVLRQAVKRHLQCSTRSCGYHAVGYRNAGESGLELNKKIQKKYPDTYRILLTSHAEFRYAQESVKLGCFDYLLQPSPYWEIEECLLRALQEIYQQRKKRRLYEYGQLLEKNETELMNHIVTEIFSRVPEDADLHLSS